MADVVIQTCKECIRVCSCDKGHALSHEHACTHKVKAQNSGGTFAFHEVIFFHSNENLEKQILYGCVQKQMSFIFCIFSGNTHTHAQAQSIIPFPVVHMKNRNQGWVTLTLRNASLFYPGLMWKLYWTKKKVIQQLCLIVIHISHKAKQIPPPHADVPHTLIWPCGNKYFMFAYSYRVRSPVCVCMCCKYSQLPQPSLPCPRLTAKCLHV